MPLEKPAYRDNLQSILEFMGNKHMMSPGQVGTYTGLSFKTVKSKFPFKNGYISAETLARELS